MIQYPPPWLPYGDGNGQATIKPDFIDDGSEQATIEPDSIYLTKKKQEEEISFSSSHETTYPWPIQASVWSERREKSESAVRKVRTYYTKKVHASLEWLSKNHRTPMSSTPYMQPLLENLKKYRDEYFTDPYSSFLSALYDALVSSDSWMKLKRDDFTELINIIIPLSNRSRLDYDTVDKAINRLEKLGLDSTPF